jgi:hypothetical protein
VSDFLGVKVDRDDTTVTVTMTQPLLIQSIIKDLVFQANSNGRHLPVFTTKILTRHSDSASHNETRNYRAIVDKVSFLKKSKRPDISVAVHQCARHMATPKLEHTKAIKAIVRYLIHTQDKGLICTPNVAALECYCDADFAGQYNKYDSNDDPNTAKSRTGFVIKYVRFPQL